VAGLNVVKAVWQREDLPLTKRGMYSNLRSEGPFNRLEIIAKNESGSIDLFRILPVPIELWVQDLIWNFWSIVGALAAAGFWFRFFGPLSAIALVFCSAYDCNFGRVTYSAFQFLF
jgi:hypothetical protein